MANFVKATRTSTGTAYTCDSVSIMIGCNISNTHASTTAKVNVTAAGAALATNLEIPAGGAVELVQGKFVMADTETVVFTLTTGSATIYVSVLDGLT